MKLEVGNYVRTEKGKIDKIIGFDGALILFLYDLVYGYIDENDIIKASNNIIDLIEVGDILKLKDTKHYQEVLAKDDEKLYLTEYIFMSGLQKYKKEIQEDLEWVITREQIENMQYKVD